MLEYGIASSMLIKLSETWKKQGPLKNLTESYLGDYIGKHASH